MSRKRQSMEEQTHAHREGSDDGSADAADGGVAAAETEGEDEQAEAGELQRLQAEANEWRDRCLRSVADMDNVRRRARLDAEDARRFANAQLLTDLLPVVDNFSRALEHAEQSTDFEALRTGVSMIHRQLTDLLGRSGLERIESLGQPFDPNLHEAIMQVEPTDGQAPNQVVEELRPGYKLSDRVVRPALVKVTSG